MRKLLLFLLALSAASGVRAADPAATYAELVAKAEAGETVDYTIMRRSLPYSPGYDPFSKERLALSRAAQDAYGADDCATVMTKTKEALATGYVDYASHAMRNHCLAKMGDKAAAMREGGIAIGLLKSLLSRGDGQSLKTAFFVVTMEEESLVLATLRLTETKRSTVTSEGHGFDRIEAADKDGKTRTVLFNVDAFVWGLANASGSRP